MTTSDIWSVWYFIVGNHRLFQEQTIIICHHQNKAAIEHDDNSAASIEKTCCLGCFDSFPNYIDREKIKGQLKISCVIY